MADIDRQSAWCNTHDDIAWLYGDGSTQCMYCLAVETSSTDCDVTAISDDRAELRERVARLTEERDALMNGEKAYLTLSAGQWAEGTPEPAATIHLLGSPANVAAVKAKLDRAEVAEAQVLLLARTLQNLVDVAKTVRGANAFHAAIEAADKVLASLPKPETEASDG